MIHEGSTVMWSSQANSRTKTKVGKIVHVIPADAFIGDVVEVGKDNAWGASELMESGMPRKHESYLVLVDDGIHKPKLYWPRVSQLREEG